MSAHRLQCWPSIETALVLRVCCYICVIIWQPYVYISSRAEMTAGLYALCGVEMAHE